MRLPRSLARLVQAWKSPTTLLGNDGDAETARRALPVLTDDPRLPLFVQADHGRLSLEGERLCPSVDGAQREPIRIADVSAVALIGRVEITTPCLHALMRADVPVSWHSRSGWFLGHVTTAQPARLGLRRAQHRMAEDSVRSLQLARPVVAAKIRATRTLLMRDAKPGPKRDVICALWRLALDAEAAEEMQELLGIEGAAASIWFGHFDRLLRSPRLAQHVDWRKVFTGRRARPATDPVNAALSFCYALLTRTLTVAASARGLEVGLGFLHVPRAGRPALALDLMEPFRPILADRCVLTAFNRGALTASHFEDADDAVRLTSEGRRILIDAFETRLGQAWHHPTYDCQLTWRQWLWVQPSLLADCLEGRRSDFPQPVIR